MKINPERKGNEQIRLDGLLSRAKKNDRRTQSLISPSQDAVITLDCKRTTFFQISINLKVSMLKQFSTQLTDVPYHEAATRGLSQPWNVP